MKLTNLQRQWEVAAKRFGLTVETPFLVRLADGRTIEAEVLVRGFGARQGTLVVSDFESIRHARSEILASGFTVSSYAQPSEKEIESLEGFEEMLADWGRVADEKRA
jgi:hypothetical protein